MAKWLRPLCKYLFAGQRRAAMAITRIAACRGLSGSPARTHSTQRTAHGAQCTHENRLTRAAPAAIDAFAAVGANALLPLTLGFG